ncbi:MAG: hypothetical protein HUJ99_04965, partial [Bacteroidaceae bacterium]|nr:hypothetical protein [Bacteroidaceae bacterium]
AFMHNKRSDFRYRGLGVGADFTLDKLTTGAKLADVLLRPLTVMAEYDTRTLNAGAKYAIWKDHINLVCELNALRHFSGGVYFRVHLK